jgi:hypothetical protein
MGDKPNKKTNPVFVIETRTAVSVKIQSINVFLPFEILKLQCMNTGLCLDKSASWTTGCLNAFW